MRRNERVLIFGEMSMKHKAVFALSFLLMILMLVVLVSAKGSEEGLLILIARIDVAEIIDLLRYFEILFIWPERYFAIKDEGLIILLSWAVLSTIFVSIWQLIEAWKRY